MVFLLRHSLIYDRVASLEEERCVKVRRGWRFAKRMVRNGKVTMK